MNTTGMFQQHFAGKSIAARISTLACLLILFFGATHAEDKKIWARSYLDQKAPALVVEKWLTPAPNYKGKFILIDFWATWCAPCRKSIPELNAFHKKFGDRLVIIGLSREDEATVRKMTEPKIDYSIAIDRAARTQAEARVEGIPHVMLIDPKGIVRWEGLPLLEGHELTEKVLKDILDKYGK
jgi:cytochrome c biogenesis protein CcmG/thiol:disulfide interchange protein DsbE